MAEDDRVELFSQNEQIVSQTHIQTSDKPSPHILRGSGSGSGSGGGGGEGNASLQEQQSHQNLFIQEDEMASWLHHPHFYSDLLYYSVLSTHPQSSVSQTQERPPLPIVTAPYDLTPERPPGQVLTARRTENFMNFSRLRANIFTSDKAESAGPWIPVVRESTKVGSSATPSSSSATESCLTLATHGTESRATAIGGVSQTFAVPGLGHKEKVVAIDKGHEIAGPSSSGVSKAETEPSQMQPATETADNKKRKDREETIEEIEETKEAPGSLSRKRSRAAEMHNISERKRREKINEKMKALQELIPRCNKTDKASMLDDAIEYVKSLQTQIQMMSMGGGGMMPMMYSTNMQRFMPDMTTMGMMGMNQPPLTPFRGSAFPRSTHTSSSNPAPRYPFPNNQAFDPSRVHVSSQQPEPVSNHPQFPGYFNPYSQFVGLHQMQQPPPSQNQTSQLSFSQASSSKESEDQENKPTG